ncbi:hypothetical protein E2C01_017182 [Portunus trituberculatus]|uniref:Uncharacterized protein n=1 Tax=Portunus trituberculatus TaxID=210409 RepID=A0A5B7DR86_PORTR|nr:hypothetical protein [Portunus trituberculatus]
MLPSVQGVNIASHCTVNLYLSCPTKPITLAPRQLTPQMPRSVLLQFLDEVGVSIVAPEPLGVLPHIAIFGAGFW